MPSDTAQPGAQQPEAGADQTIEPQSTAKVLADVGDLEDDEPPAFERRWTQEGIERYRDAADTGQLGPDPNADPEADWILENPSE